MKESHIQFKMMCEVIDQFLSGFHSYPSFVVSDIWRENIFREIQLFSPDSIIVKITVLQDSVNVSIDRVIEAYEWDFLTVLNDFHSLENILSKVLTYSSVVTYFGNSMTRIVFSSMNQTSMVIRDVTGIFFCFGSKKNFAYKPLVAQL